MRQIEESVRAGPPRPSKSPRDDVQPPAEDRTVLGFAAMGVLRQTRRRPILVLCSVICMAMAVSSFVTMKEVTSVLQLVRDMERERTVIDIVVLRAGGGGGRNSLPQTFGEKLKQVPGVRQAVPATFDMIEIPALNRVLINGWVPETVPFQQLPIRHGRSLVLADRRAMIVGTTFAETTKKTVGDKMEILEVSFEIVGIYESGHGIENDGIVMPLASLQQLTGGEGRVTSFFIILDNDRPERVEATRAAIEKLRPNVAAIATGERIRPNDKAIDDTILLLTHNCWFVPLVLGFVGILQIISLSVRERTREIGILRAVGWKVSRVIRMVLIESVFLSILGALAGTLGAIAVLRLLTRMPRVNGIIEGKIDPALVAYGFLIAIGVGLLAGLFPANRAARMLPTEALRHE